MDNTAINMDAYEAIKGVMGEIFSDVITTFLDYIPGQISKLGDAIEREDSTEIFHLAHSIKSSCGSIGALGLAETAATIEQLGRNSDTADVPRHFEKLQEQFQSAAEFLQQHYA